MMANKLLLLSAVAIGVSGCASSGRLGELPVVTSDRSPSELVLVRASRFVGSGNSYYVALDGTDVFSIRSGEYTKFAIAAGEHFISVKCFGGWTPTWKEDSRKFFAFPEQTSYFQIKPNLECAEIEPIASGLAKDAIGRSKFVDPSVVSDKK